MGNLKLTSSAFSDGGEIPRKYGYKNGNVSPPLTIEGFTRDTKSLTLIMDDPDAMAAVGKVWVHWVVYNIYPYWNKQTDSPYQVLEIPESKTTSVAPLTMAEWRDPATDRIKRFSEFNRESYGSSFGMFGVTDFDEFAYGGPAPPDKPHTYVFKLYALDIGGFQAYAGSHDVPTTKSDVEKVMEDHILDGSTIDKPNAILKGTYAP